MPTRPSVLRVDLPATWRQTSFLPISLSNNYFFVLSSNKSLASHELVIPEESVTFFFSHMSWKNCPVLELSEHRSRLGKKSQGATCAWMVYLRSEGDLVTRRHLVLGKHEERPLLGVSW